MNRINKVGQSLLDYKREYSNHYSPIVDESLIISLENKLEKKVLSQETFDLIINDSISYDDFKKYILNKKEYLKTYKELFDEFEKVRMIVNEALHKVNFINFIETESNVETNQITILRQYTITDEYIKVFFGLEDSDMIQIMKKKGFAEKFAVLRLTKVLKEILSEMRVDEEFSQGCSKVYYNSDCNGFSIDYKYRLNVDSITEENIEDKIKKIRDTDRVVERKFVTKTSIKFYSLKPIEPKVSETLNLRTSNPETTITNTNKNIPNNKLKDLDITKEELEKVQNELINSHTDNNLNNVNNTEKVDKVEKVEKIEKETQNEEVIKNTYNNVNKKEEIKKDKSSANIVSTNIVDKIENHENNESIEIEEELIDVKKEEDFSEEFFKEDFSGFIPEEDIYEDINIDDLKIEMPTNIDDTDDL